MKDLVNNYILTLQGSGAPTDGSTGLYIAGYGSRYIDRATGNIYVNRGSQASPVWAALAGPGVLLSKSGTITSANITGTSAGQLGHANGVELVPAGGAHVINEFVSAILINDYATAAYTGGGNTTINIGGGGAALSGLVSNANFIQASADKVIQFLPLAATFLTLTENTGINLVTASAPTQPGTAAGVFRYIVNYRQHNTGL